MPLNLSKLNSTSLLDIETSPREVFNLLPNMQARYKYPRDVQTQVGIAGFRAAPSETSS